MDWNKYNTENKTIWWQKQANIFLKSSFQCLEHKKWLSSVKQQFFGYQMLSALPPKYIFHLSAGSLFQGYVSQGWAIAPELLLPNSTFPSSFNPFSTEQLKWSLKIVNQILTPFSLKSSNGLWSHLKSKIRILGLDSTHSGICWPLQLYPRLVSLSFMILSPHGLLSVPGTHLHLRKLK